MNIKSFFKKNKNKILLSELHPEIAAPEKHWVMILLLSFLVIILGAIISLIFFLSILNKEKSSDTPPPVPQTLDMNKVQSAVEFIKSR